MAVRAETVSSAIRLRVMRLRAFQFHVPTRAVAVGVVGTEPSMLPLARMGSKVHTGIQSYSIY